MIFHQFHATDGQLSYLFADSVTRNAVALDPHLSLEQDYISLIRRLDLHLEFIVETHAHESHLSAAPLLCERTGARWMMSRRVAGETRARPVEHGESVYIGEEHFAVVETPGHSACSICFYWRDRIFTGHTLLVGRAGDCNRPDADPARLYESITGKLYVLPEDTLVYPGMGSDSACKSTIHLELDQNRELNVTTGKNQFISLKQSQNPQTGDIPQCSMPDHPGSDLYPFRKAGAA